MSMEPQTVEHEPDAGETAGVLLGQVGNAYWLLDGEEHLDALLSGQESYPAPVKCLRFSSSFHMQALMPMGQQTGHLWGVHPAIIERLKRRGELMVFTAPEAN
ncbi:hypothetical protein [Roseibium litorale]|uniref:Uncharacterized protein n=1 Tax=Roseibium litorale TaxID=2803841 RepID=A0ABR9CKA6_9HYPH|nr:hypothetical protein [Roseibium litorale]MBD8891290.1 hypothetical protein [Roseibium litorale]